MANPSLLVYGGPIYTGPSVRSRVEALAISEATVSDSGPARDILRLKARSTETLNLQGRVVVPGFTDSHIHLLNYGMLLRTLDLTEATSIKQIKSRVAMAASSRSPNTWILGRGWDQEKLRERRYPNKRDLDVAFNPVFLRRVCGHVAVANSRALSISGITSSTADPEGGVIVKSSGGEPNGVLKENAVDLVQRSIPRSKEETRSALLSACKELAKLGITSLHCIIEDAAELRTLRDLKIEGKIPQSIYGIIPQKLLDSIMPLDLSADKGKSGLRVGGVKVYLDGSLGARTAALIDPYADDPNSSGMITLAPEKLMEVAARAQEASCQLCVHAIGDRAIETALQTLGKVFGPQDCRHLRHRIEHSSLAPPRLISQMRKLGVVASVQPRFIYSDTWARSRLGLRRVRYLYPFSSIVRAGVQLAAGSDCPTEYPSPLEGIWSAVVRPGLGSEERLTVDQAIRAYTVGASYASFSENERGTLEPGRMADMVALDGDPFESRPESLREISVVSTLVGGQVVA